jgi:copper homeostasis protein
LDSVESAIIAQVAGADRVELCANLAEGGTTPSLGIITATRQSIYIPLHVIIRPRSGDFHYTFIEFEVMKSDIQAVKQAGADGVVLGILMSDGTIDVERTKVLVDLARPMSVTFHRAFDMASEPTQALEDVIKTGADRLLTSGQQKTAFEGKELIAKLVEKSRERIIIMPGAGINETNINELINATHANEFHMSANSKIPGKMQFKPTQAAIGSNLVSEFEIIRTDYETVKRIVEKVTE